MISEKKSKTDIQKLAIEYKNNKTDINFSKLIESIECPLYVYVSGYISGYDNIRHIMVQTYESIWKHFDKYNPTYKFTTWCFTIAKNKALNAKRGQSQHIRMFDTDGHEPIGGDFSDLIPCDAALREEFINCVYYIIRNLDEPYSTVMYLKDIKNINTNDIAEMIGENAATIRWRVYKARKDVGVFLTSNYPHIIECLRTKQT